MASATGGRPPGQPIRTAPAERYGSAKQQETMQQTRRLPEAPGGNPSPPPPAGAGGQRASTGAARPPSTSNPADVLSLISAQPTEFPGEAIVPGRGPDPARIAAEDQRFALEELIRNSKSVSQSTWALWEKLVREQYQGSGILPQRSASIPSGEGLL